MAPRCHGNYEPAVPCHARVSSETRGLHHLHLRDRKERGARFDHAPVLRLVDGLKGAADANAIAKLASSLHVRCGYIQMKSMVG